MSKSEEKRGKNLDPLQSIAYVIRPIMNPWDKVSRL